VPASKKGLKNKMVSMDKLQRRNLHLKFRIIEPPDLWGKGGWDADERKGGSANNWGWFWGKTYQNSSREEYTRRFKKADRDNKGNEKHVKRL